MGCTEAQGNVASAERRILHIQMSSTLFALTLLRNNNLSSQHAGLLVPNEEDCRAKSHKHSLGYMRSPQMYAPIQAPPFCVCG